MSYRIIDVDTHITEPADVWTSRVAAKYRTREEVEKVRGEQDPIEQVRQRLLKNKWVSEDDLKKIDAKVRDTVNEAAEFATHDPEPDPSELYTDVLVESY